MGASVFSFLLEKLMDVLRVLPVYEIFFIGKEKKLNSFLYFP